VLLQLPCCAGVESLNRLKASDWTVTGTVAGAPLEEEELLELDELLDELELEELDVELVLVLPLEELELELLLALEELLAEELLLDDALVEELPVELELEAAPDELELDSSPPWVTNKPSPPQALSVAKTRLSVSARRGLVAGLRKPEENMKNTPHKCVIRVHVKHPGAEKT
jgi:hypothetical protein